MNEAHDRFQDWLTAGAEGDPPRDLAVHASVCAVCTQSIAALDLLAGVDPGRAAMPAVPTGAERGRMALAGRLLGATAVLFAAAMLGVGASQLIGVSRSAGPIAQASRSPEQSVLGGTATPQPTAEATPTPSQETLSPLVTPAPTPRPLIATPVPYVPPPPTPIPPPVPTPIPTAVPTPLPTDTPSATPSPTPGPTVPAAIADLVALPGSSAGQINLTWSAPADGGSPILGYTICRGTVQGSWPDCISAGNVTSFPDTALSSGTLYYYVVQAVNAVGPGAASNEASATAP